MAEVGKFESSFWLHACPKFKFRAFGIREAFSTLSKRYICFIYIFTLHAHSLLVTQFRCEAHCDVQHNELVLLEMDGKLDKGELDARGGVIAGNILMKGAQARGEPKYKYLYLHTLYLNQNCKVYVV